MKITMLPKTKLGKWAFWLFIAGVVAMLFFVVAIRLPNMGGGDTFFAQPILAIPIFLVWICGSASFITAVIAMVFKKDFSILVAVMALFSFVVMYFGIAEVISAH